MGLIKAVKTAHIDTNSADLEFRDISIAIHILLQ